VRVEAVVAMAFIETAHIWGEGGRNISFATCRRGTNRLDEWLALYRLTAASFMIGEAHVVIIDRSFIRKHRLALAWRTRHHGSS
jgi:hypothetical protein